MTLYDTGHPGTLHARGDCWPETCPFCIVEKDGHLYSVTVEHSHNGDRCDRTTRGVRARNAAHAADLVTADLHQEGVEVYTATARRIT